MTDNPLAHICSGWCNHPDVPTVVVTLAYLDTLRADLTIADTTAANLHDEIRKRDEAIATLRADVAATIDRWAEALSEIATLRAALDGLVEPLGEWLIEMMERNLTPAEATLYDALRAALATTKEAGGG